MNAKKIAEKIREIASFYSPNDGCTNAIYDAQIAIANELDPPAKPLLADAHVGDLCRLRQGGYTQIDSVKRRGGKTCYDRTDGYASYPDGRLFKGENNEPDIIHTEPLAEVGSAEWAWQMMLLGKMVCNQKLTARFCRYDGYQIFRDYGGADPTNVLPEQSVTARFPYSIYNGWQLYAEPQPQPAYAVEDWVEYKKGKHYQVDSVHDGCCYLSYGKGCGCFSALYSDITRKLDPSEVRIKVTLDGTVERHDGNPQYWFKLRSSEYNYALISINMLDTATRELVEALLKAQEEKCHS